MTVRFSASNAARLMACPASANLDLAIPNWEPPVVDPTAGAKGAGTIKHELLEQLMNLSAKDIDGFAKILRYIADLRATRRFKVMVEEKITATWLQSQPYTTPDLVLYTQDEIHVIDYKWGKIPVPVVDNEQLLFLAVTLAPLAPKAKGVRLHILQPPLDIFESWFADTNVLRAFMDEAIKAEQKVLKKDLTFGPSDHCKFCPANPHSRGDKGHPMCPAMMQILYPAPFDEAELLGS